jgi:hypothetical protein
MIDNCLVQKVHRKFQSSMTEHYRSHLDGTNINKTSMLTTDYLNHFSGVLMLLEMLPSDPEGLSEEVLNWSPITYEEHFEETGFPDRELAVKAYEHAPIDVREAFDDVIDEMNDRFLAVLNEVRGAVSEKRPEELAQFCQDVAPQMHELISQAATIVNEGITNVIDINAREGGQKDAQEEIDALFD